MNSSSMSESHFWKQASIERVVQELKYDQIKDALSVAKIALWAHDKDAHFAQEMVDVIIETAERLILQRKNAQATKLLLFCKNSKVDCAKTHYFLHIVYAYKKEKFLSSTEKKKALLLDKAIEEQFTTVKKYFLKIKTTVLEVFQFTNTLDHSSKWLIGDKETGNGTLHGFQVASARSSKAKDIPRGLSHKVLLKEDDVKIIITTNPILSIEDKAIEPILKDENDNIIPGKKRKGVITFQT